MKTGMVLEGGAMRGLFTAGVLDVMMENGIDVDAAAAVSAGACFGCNFKSRQIGRVLRYSVKYCQDPRYSGLRSLLWTGNLYSEHFCYHDVPEYLDKMDVETYENNPLKFYIVATDADTGEAVYHLCGKCDSEEMEWYRASSSMPFVSKPVRIRGRKYLDGGIKDPIPLKFMEEQGYGQNIVVLTRELGYRKKPMHINPLMELRMFRYTKILEALAERHEIYNATLDDIQTKERKGSLFVIRPPAPLDIGPTCHDPDEIRRVYEIGRRTMEENMEAMKLFLK